MSFSLFVLKYSLRENTMGGISSAKKKKYRLIFFFWSRNLKQENCHVWQIAAGWFP